MKSTLSKIMFCVFVAIITGLALGGCWTERPRQIEETLIISSTTYFTFCIDSDAELFEKALDEAEYVFFDNYKDFVLFFGDRDYQEYCHLLSLYDNFNFTVHNMLVLRSEPLKVAKTINFSSWVSINRLNTSLQGRGMHYYLAILEKSQSSIILEP